MAGNLVIRVGASYFLRRQFTRQDVLTFSTLCGDCNPIHLEDAAAQRQGFRRSVVHGMLLSSLFSTILGNYLPGPSSVYASQQLRFKQPVYIDEAVVAVVRVRQFRRKGHWICLDTTICKGLDANNEGAVDPESCGGVGDFASLFPHQRLEVCVEGRAVGQNKTVTFEGESEWDFGGGSVLA